MNQSNKGYSVLIIEDNPGDQLLLQESLKSTHLIIDQITTADTIAEAMGLLEQNTFSIIFLDLFLPDSAGLETFQQLIKLTSKIPVIISSGLSDTSIAVKAISMGAQDFLIKGDYTGALLEKAFRYGIERKGTELLIKSSEEKVAEEKIKKQREITTAIINAQEQERSFLGKELHDNINQILATVKLYLDCVLTDEVPRISLVKDSKDLVTDAMEEIRKLSKTLLPPSLGEISLHEALGDVIDKIKLVSNSIHFQVDWNISNENTISEELKLCIYRITQEQLNNIFKHAQASNIIITLQQEEEMLRLSIKDDGVGFDAAKKRNGVGLQNITSRAELLTGTVLIKTSPGAGCELIIDFICKNNVPGAVIIRA